jgi:cytoskeletal protein RodZ
MAIWDRFRKKDQSVLPEEVKQYYQSEQRQRAGVAVLLGIAAVVITVLVALGLFYGGRYAYRQVNKSDTQTANQAEQKQTNQNQATSSDNPSSPSSDTPATSSTPQTDSPPPSTPAPPSHPTASSPSSLGDEPAPAANMPHTGDPGM